MTADAFTPGDLPRLLTIPETAKILRISQTTAFLMAKNKELPTVRIGGRCLIPAKELTAWIEDRVVAAQEGLRLLEGRRSHRKASGGAQEATGSLHVV